MAFLLLKNTQELLPNNSKLKMNTFLKSVLAAGALATGINSIEAGSITGFIEFVSDPQKSVTIVGSDLASATGLSFEAGPNANIQNATGSFALEKPGTATFFSFNFGNPVDPVWTLTSGDFSFSLDNSVKSVGTFFGNTFLNISGTGIVTGNGYDPTPGEFSFTISTSNPDVLTFGWQSTTTATPDGGATAALLGMGVLGAAGLRRKLS